MRFSYKQYEKEFARRTKELERAYRKGDTLKTISYLRYLSCFYYLINYKMTDDLLEEILCEISRDLLGKTLIQHSDSKTVLFYDYFGLAFRGLANIYVTALEKLGYHVLWVLYENAPDVAKLKKMFSGRDNVSFMIIPKIPVIDRMHALRQVVLENKPKHILVYTVPDDVAGIGVMSTVRGDVTRYLVDLTDHAFWLGKRAVDYVIGFRNCGYNIAVQYRHIDPDKILILPYYPAKREGQAFEGMPFDTDKHEFVFSGGSLYKIEGDTAYEEIVTYILEKYPDLYFVYAGNGKSRKLDLIKQDYPGRFFQVDERADLDEVLKHAKFFLATFPLSGGLMIQYALQNNCIPLNLCMEKGGVSDPRTLLLDPGGINFIFYEKDKLLSEIDRIMADKKYYMQSKEKLQHHVIQEEEFTEQLSCVLEKKWTCFPKTREDIDIGMEKFLETYKARATYEQYCNIIYASHNKWVWKKHPFIVRKEQRKNDGK